MMAVPAVALVQYTGPPQMPYLVYGHVNWNDQLLAGTRLEITNQNTGFTKMIVTNVDGYWQEDSGSWQTNAAGRPPVMYGDTIKVRALDGCGTGDTCEKSFEAHTGSLGSYKDWAVVNLELTGTLSCPPISCPSCGSCGGGGSSSGGGGGYCIPITEDRCRDKYPYETTTTTTDCPAQNECPAEKTCPTTEDKNCPPCIESVCPETEGSGVWIIISSILAGLGGLGIGGYFIKRKEALSKGVGIKIYTRRNGAEGVYHKHPGIKGYHDPDISHRDKKERHPKGELTPKYNQEDSGDWVYEE